MQELILETTVTCPFCGHRFQADMPENACVQRIVCPACAEVATPAKGDCCVFCTHGDHVCPPIQEERA